MKGTIHIEFVMNINYRFNLIVIYFLSNDSKRVYIQVGVTSVIRTKKTAGYTTQSYSTRDVLVMHQIVKI